MAEQHYLDMELHLSDQEEVETRQAERTRWNYPRNDPNGTLRTLSLFGIPLGGNGQIYASPDRIVAEYGGSLVKYGEARPANPPYITSPWLFPVSSPDRYPTDKDYFDRKSGGWFGISFLFGRTDRYTWRAKYVYTPSTTPVDGPSGPGLPQTIRRRRWIDGFELPSNGAGSGMGESAAGNNACPDASRHPEGLGIRFVEPANFTHQHSTIEHLGGVSPSSSWERLYVRFWTLPTASWEFWKAHNAAGGVNGVSLSILPGGQIACNDVTNAGARNVMATSAAAVTLGKWYRLDMLFGTVNQAGGLADFDFYINRVQAFHITSFPAGGWGAGGGAALHADSRIGNELALTAGVCLDIDDWICADRATAVANELGLDWLNGSKVIGVLHANAYGPGHTGGGVWGANKNFLSLAARPGLDVLSTEPHITSTPSVVLETVYDTEVLRRINGDPKCIKGGIVAATWAVFQAANVGSGNGSLSMSRNGAAFDAGTAQAGVSAALNWDHHAYFPSGLTEPEALTALSGRYTTGLGAFVKTVNSCGFQCEVLGVFDEADTPPTSVTGTPPEPPDPMIVHSLPYDRTPWTYNTGIAPVSPVSIKSGTFVGNDGITSLTFRAPVHFLWIRRVTAAIAKNATWWSTMTAPVRGTEQPTSPEQMIRSYWRLIVPPPGAGEDLQEAECVVDIAGVAANASGVTYEYVAFMDPGMRFLLNAAVHHNRGAVDRETALFKPTYLGEFAIFHRHSVGGSTNAAIYIKGLGHAAGDVNRVDNVVTANAVELAAGLVRTKSAFVPVAASTGDQNMPFALFRRDDGTGDPGIPDTLHIVTWVGDGTASRTITLAGTTKRPLFALAIGHNGTSTVFRDPAHTGTTSHQITTADSMALLAATGITGGGSGSISVGSVLNANGVIYELLVIMGGDTACNGGFSCDGTFDPVDPIEPPDWPDDDNPTDDDEDPNDGDPDDGDPGDGGGGGGGDDPAGEDFGTQCVAASTKVINQALSYIGVTQRVLDVVNETTVEAEQARLHYADCVNEALREYPWPFATKYVALTLLAGVDSDNPVNNDWIFAYQVPADLIYARRILNVEEDKRRGFDANPPQFRMGTSLVSSVNTHVLFCDTEDAELEYTYRPDCAASRGDAIFRNALSWLLASKLAPGLARNKITTKECFAMFLEQIARAKTVNARESQPNPDASGDAPWLRERQ